MWTLRCTCNGEYADKLILLRFGIGKQGMDDVVWFDCLCGSCGVKARHYVKMWLLCGAISFLEASEWN